MAQSPSKRSAYLRFCELATRWSDNDVYGHVNNVLYYSYFDTAVNRFLIENGALDIRDKNGIVGYVVETGCTYFSGVAFPDTLQVGASRGAPGHVKRSLRGGRIPQR